MTDEARAEEKNIIRKWLKRTFYVILLLVVFVSVPFILNAIIIWANGGDWTEAFSQTWFGDTDAARIFLLGFVVIVGLFTIIIYFILSIFGSDEGGW
ncbi:MAG: hypothetical protein ACW97G_12080 [Candidatus Thorarchaeota archaeon]